MVNPLDIDNNTNEDEIIDNLKKYHFSFALNNILIIRSYSPLLDELVELLKGEFPKCVIDILQVKNSVPYTTKHQSVHVHESKSEKGFMYRYLIDHHVQFEEKKYDAVFVLYGVDRDTSVNFNADLYGLIVPSRYTVVYDIHGKFRVITLPVLILRVLFYIFSCFKFAANVALTFLIVVLSSILMLLLSPLSLFYKRDKK